MNTSQLHLSIGVEVESEGVAIPAPHVVLVSHPVPDDGRPTGVGDKEPARDLSPEEGIGSHCTGDQQHPSAVATGGVI